MKRNFRIVWRFAKTRKSGELSLKTKSMVVGEFMETMVGTIYSSGNTLLSNIYSIDFFIK